ncbi:hypothetical protein FRC11_006936 [Ceratobasidium sp. 423]|nr:hypothetical protein FRC11_006936 [Ceratobasidium sp. 423]
MEVLDKMFDNPPVPEGHICSCDNCLHVRGESTFRERMLASRESSADEPNRERMGAGEPEDQENSGAEDEVTEEPKPRVKALTSHSYRPSAQRLAYVDALNDWVDFKYNSEECTYWDITKDSIMTDKQIKSISMHPGMSSKEDLRSIKPNWVHYDRWGTEVFEIVAGVNRKLQEDKEREAEAKRLAVEERRAKDHERQEEAKKRKADQQVEQEPENRVAEASVSIPLGAEADSSAGTQAAKRPRLRLKANAMPDERAAHAKQVAERKKAGQRERYQRKKLEKAVKKEEVDQHKSLESASEPAPPQPPLLQESAATTSTFTLEAKQEEVENYLVFDDTTTPAVQTTPANPFRMYPYHVPPPMPPTPSSSTSTPLPPTPSSSRVPYPTPSAPGFEFTWVMDDLMTRQQATPQTNPRTTTAVDTAAESPSTQPQTRRRPRMKTNVPTQPSNPSPSL